MHTRSTTSVLSQSRSLLLSSLTKFARPSICRYISSARSTMAPPKSAFQFLDFVNASPTRRSSP